MKMAVEQGNSAGQLFNQRHGFFSRYHSTLYSSLEVFVLCCRDLVCKVCGGTLGRADRPHADAHSAGLLEGQSHNVSMQPEILVSSTSSGIPYPRVRRPQDRCRSVLYSAFGYLEMKRIRRDRGISTCQGHNPASLDARFPVRIHVTGTQRRLT